MKAVSSFCNGFDKAYKFFYYLAGAILAALMCISFFVVVARTVFDYSPIWSDEIQRFLMVVMVFSAVPYMACTKTFLVVDLVATLFSKKKKFNRITVFIGEIILIVLFIYLIIPCSELAVKNMGVYSSAMRIPMGIMYAVMPISFIFGALAMIKNIVKFLVVDCRSTTEEVQ